MLSNKQQLVININRVEKELNQVVCRVDKVVYDFSKDLDEEDCGDVEEVFIMNDVGEYLLYTQAREDLNKVEEEFLKIGTYYIDKFEQTRQFTRAENQENYIIVDRFKVLYDLYECEARFQFAKVNDMFLLVTYR